MAENDLLRVLENLVPKEIIDGQDIAELAKTCVMLDVAYKPVVRHCVTQDDKELVHYIPPVVDVVKERPDGNYELHWANSEGQMDFEVVSALQLKVMRARYITVLNYYRKNWHRITRPIQQEIHNQYDIGFVPDPESKLGKLFNKEA